MTGRMVKPLPTHTPYDGSAKPFTIGLKPLDPSHWIEIDEQREAYLAEKQRLYAEIPEKVFVAEEGTQAAQQEVLDLIVGHLREQVPKLSANAASSNLAAHPLYTASLLVQEDLVLMRRSEDGWRLVAASLCFPSAWSLQEK